MTPDEVVTEARRWLGTPYQNRGRSIRGLDCLGLLVVVGQHFEVPHVDETVYSNWPRGDHLILRRLAQHLDRWPTSMIASGMIGVFAERRLPGHVGIFSKKHNVLHLIHARIWSGRVIEEPWDAVPRTEMRLIGLFCFPGLTDLEH